MRAESSPRIAWAVRPHRPHGVTLIEMLVVVAIIGVLVGLLLPSLQAAREGSRRAACLSKMRDIGLALHGYASANQVLPPSVENWGGCGEGTPPPVIKSMSGLVPLLPMLEQQVLYDRLRMDQAFERATGDVDFLAGIPLLGGSSTFNATTIAAGCPGVFTCPSEVEWRSRAGTNGIAPLPRTNYDFIVSYWVHWNHCGDWANPTKLTRRAMFADGSACRWSHLRDGASQTAMMAETRRLCCIDGNNATWGNRVYSAFGLSLTRTPNTTRRCSLSSTAGHCTRPGGFPNPAGSGCCMDNYRELADYGTPGSHHPGGMGLLLADGSVRFLTNDTSWTVRVSLEQIADGSTLSDF